MQFPKYQNYRKKRVFTTPQNTVSRTFSPSSLSKYLIIVESPSKCKKVEEFMGGEYTCIASKGHICNISGLKSIDTKNNFHTKFSIVDEKKAHIESMRYVIQMFPKTNIILATDNDREGEAIAWHICQVFDLPVETTKRILFHEITKSAFQSAVKTPTVINMKLVHAQQSRQILDMLVGYKISPVLWKYLYNDKTKSLSAGRCQTPALRLVYDNEIEKDAMGQIELKYKTTGFFTSRSLEFELNREFDDEVQVADFLEDSKEFPHQLTLSAPRESSRSPPKPFSTSKLLQVASNQIHMSPKETMALCQTLYQDGFITYMRTDCTKYSVTFIETAKLFIEREWRNPKLVGDTAEIANMNDLNPHEAIRVTNLEIKEIATKENPRLSSLYRLIWKNTVESCMSSAQYNVITAKISAPEGGEYRHTIDIPRFLGWKQATESSDLAALQSIANGTHFFLKSIESSQSLIPYQYIESHVSAKNKHHHYTDATLIQKLEDLGIGRPSTFATIIETIIDRGYVKRMNIEGTKIKTREFKLRGDVKEIEKIEIEKVYGNEKNKLVIQSVGTLTVEFLITQFNELFSYNYTNEMEIELDRISSGEIEDWTNICKKCNGQIKGLLKLSSKIQKQTYPLDENHEVVYCKFGPVIRTIPKEETEEPVYKSIKKGMLFDLEKLKTGQYTLDDLLEIQVRELGTYQDAPLYLKTGMYGAYVEWGERKESVKSFEIPFDEITAESVLEYLKSRENHVEGSTGNVKGVLRMLTDDLSVRKGKFGAYIFYKRKDMKVPTFLKLGKFSKEYDSCDVPVLLEWIYETYKIPRS